jgi:hypothetical protein
VLAVLLWVLLVYVAERSQLFCDGCSVIPVMTVLLQLSLQYYWLSLLARSTMAILTWLCAKAFLSLLFFHRSLVTAVLHDVASCPSMAVLSWLSDHFCGVWLSYLSSHIYSIAASCLCGLTHCTM